MITMNDNDDFDDYHDDEDNWFNEHFSINQLALLIKSITVIRENRYELSLFDNPPSLKELILQ